MSFLSQAPPLGGLSPPHGAFQEHAAHAREWSMALNSKGSLGTCIPKGVSTFFHTAFTAHSEVRAEAIGGRLPGRADGCPSGPPTDPYVRNSRIRFLKQSLCYPPQSTGVLVSGLVSSKSLPWFPPVGHSARRRLPSRGSLGPRFPTFRGTMRRYDCHCAPLGSLRLSLASRYLARFSRSWCPRRARCLVEAPRQRQGLWSPGPPFRASRQGDTWLSQVPEFPL
jgi:hypothetical protein